MTGSALIYSTQAEYETRFVKVKQNNDKNKNNKHNKYVEMSEVAPVSRVGVIEATLHSGYTVDNHNVRDIVCSNRTWLNKTVDENDPGVNEKVHWYCVKPLSNSSFIVGKENEYTFNFDASRLSELKSNIAQSVNFIWSYGEGQYTDYGMHSARGACSFQLNYNWTQLANHPDDVSYTFCLHEQNIITESGVKKTNDVVIQGLTRGISVSKEKFMQMSGYYRYLNNENVKVYDYDYDYDNGPGRLKKKKLQCTY